MPTPCESWPRRFASTRLVATMSASRSDEPPAWTIERMVAVSAPASKMRSSDMAGAAVEGRTIIGAPLRPRSDDQHRPEVVDVGVRRPGHDQVAERVEEPVGVVAIEAVARLQAEA